MVSFLSRGGKNAGLLLAGVLIVLIALIPSTPAFTAAPAAMPSQPAGSSRPSL